MPEIVERRKARWPATSRPLTLSLACFLVGGVIWGSWAWWTDRSYRDAIMQVELEMANGRFATAARYLTTLLAQQPDSGEAAILLARCEQERGRNEAAAKAFERVAPGSVFSHRAILGRMRLAHDKGQFAVAEQIVNSAAEDPRNDGSHARFLLVPIYSQLGRIDEAQRLIEERWEHLNEAGEGASESAIDLVRMHIELTLKPNPVESTRAYLEQAAGLAPDDDRVWLGRANLAIRTGAYDEARRWLDACLERRPDDLPVWRARLSWGIAADRIDVVHESLRHLPARDATPAEVHRLKAWLAAKRGDVAAELPREKAEMDRLLARYRKLYDRNQPIRDAVELADLAEQLGRPFEARVFLTVAIAQGPDPQEEPEFEDLRQRLRRLSQTSKPAASRGQTLAEVIDEQGGMGRSHAVPSP